MVCKFNSSAYVKRKWWAIAIMIGLIFATIITVAMGGDFLIISFEITLIVVPPARIWHYLIGKKYNVVTIYNDVVVIDESNNDFMVPRVIRTVVHSVDQFHIEKYKIVIQGNIQTIVYRTNMQVVKSSQSRSFELMREYENEEAICEKLSSMMRKPN